jgi:hypothetical protein
MEGAMAGIRLFNIHYGWEDCISMALGALILLSSWMTDDAFSRSRLGLAQ